MHCKNCGEKLSEDVKFCTKCGAPTTTSSTGELDSEKGLASQGKRLANYVVDRILMAFSVGILSAINPILAFVALVGYYIFFESIWQRTPGKWITKTKVVNEQGEKPTFGQIVGRSFARFIPFEPFSFFFGNHMVGWHDSLAKTYVVPAELTPEEFKKIDLKKTQGSKNNVAVVIVAAVVGIAIIGILSSVVLASLNTARGKGNDAKVKAELSGARAAAEIYYDAHGNSYGPTVTSCAKGIFADASSGMSMYTDLKNYPEGVDLACVSNGDMYIMGAVLPSGGGVWCVDSLGHSSLIPDGYTVNTSCTDLEKE